MSYFDRVVKCIIGDYEFEVNPSQYKPGFSKLATVQRTKNGSLIVHAIADADDATKVAVKRVITISGLDVDVYDNILVEFVKGESLYFRSPLGEEFDGTGTAGHFKKVYFVGFDTEFNPNLNMTTYSVTLQEM